ncbi:hypothetical protein WN51_07667 [Melipona quadrifasciata]|uniref:Uncharacterized protein n=1 Tax=Melipona quadrifasciata TaxID=166423 RepID=A0A0N0BBW8_9HYME|nr:hypothetical protein WN51_07667 [Melipona quadrifasciata]
MGRSLSAGPRYWKLIAYTIARHEGGRRRPAEPVPNRGSVGARAEGKAKCSAGDKASPSR